MWNITTGDADGIGEELDKGGGGVGHYQEDGRTAGADTGFSEGGVMATRGGGGDRG